MMENIAPEALLAIIGLAVAVYALLPSERQLQLKLSIHRLDWAIIGLSLAVVHYILFFPVFYEIGWYIPWGPWKWGFTPALSTYAILLGVFLHILIRVSFAKIPKSRLITFQKLVEQLRVEEKYARLLFLLEQNLPSLIKGYHNNYLTSQLKKWLNPSRATFLEIPDKKLAPKWLRKAVLLLPENEEAVQSAKNAIRRLLLSENFAIAVARIKPYFAISLVDQNFYETKEFEKLWLKALLKDAGSVLYFEIKNNQIQLSTSRFVIEPSNQIINYYFANAETAYNHAIYKPLGDLAYEELDRRLRSPETDKYNDPLDDFYDSRLWESEIHAVLQLFSIMVSEALYQGTEWHMWLYYLRGITEKIERNLDPTDLVDETDEWPTPYHYFLYKVVLMLSDWVISVTDIPKDQQNVKLDQISVIHQNDNIPKSAAIALGVCFSMILGSRKLTDKFKSYLLEIPLGHVKDHLFHSKEHCDYGQVLLLCLAKGGYRNLGQSYYAKFDLILTGIDSFIKYDVDKELKKLRAAKLL